MALRCQELFRAEKLERWEIYVKLFLFDEVTDTSEES